MMTPPCDGLSDLFFSEVKVDQAHAKTICAGCPLRQPCLERAKAGPEQFGVWGGVYFGRGRTYVRKTRDLPEWPTEEVA